MQETPRNQWPIPEWDVEWLAWQNKFNDLMTDVDSTVFANMENLKVVFKSIPNASVINDSGTMKLVMTGDLVIKSRTYNTDITVDSSVDLELSPGYMIGAVLTPGAVGPQDTAFELYSSAEIDPSIQIFGFVDDAYTINWFNGSTFELGDPSRQLFSFKSTAGGGDNYTVMVTGADTTPGYLSSKLVQGSGVTLTVQNPGANENILIDASGTGYWDRTGTVLSPLNSGDSVEITIPDGGNAAALTLTQNDDTNDSHVFEVVQNASSGSAWYNDQAYSMYLYGSGGSADGFVIFANNDLVFGNRVATGDLNLLIASRTEGSGNAAETTVSAEATSSGSTLTSLELVSDDDVTGYRSSIANLTSAVASGEDAGVTTRSNSSGYGYTSIWSGAGPLNYVIVRKQSPTAYNENIVMVSETGVSIDADYLQLGSTVITDGFKPVGWSADGIELSASPTEWTNIEALIGSEGSIFAAILAAAASGGSGGTLNDAYDFGGPGVGRSITADSGSVLVTVPDSSGNVAVEIVQNDSTGDPDCLVITNNGGGNSIYIDGVGLKNIYSTSGLYVQAVGSVGFDPGSNLNFSDGYRSSSGWLGAMPFSDSATEWDDIRTLLGGSDGSLLAAILAAVSSGSGGTLDDAYDFGGPGSGGSITVDSGSVVFTVPGSGTSSALSLTNQNSANTSEVISVYNDASLSTGYTMYLQGNAGGGGTDYLEFGHLIWSPGSVTIGHGTGSGDTIRRSYTSYHYRFDGDVPWASAEMKAEADTAYGQAASVVCRAGNYGAVSARVDLDSTAYIGLNSTLSTTITTGSGNLTLDSGSGIRFSDGNRSGSSWGGAYMNLSTGTEWSDIETLIGSEGTLFGAILAASTGGVSRPDKEVIWGTGSGVSSEGNFTYDDDYNQVRIINNHNETNWYDTNAASLLLQGSSTQGNPVVANGDLVLGSLHSTINNTASLIARNTDATSTYYPSVDIAAQPTAGTTGTSIVNMTADYYGNGAGVINIEGRGQGNTGYFGGQVNIIAYASVSSNQTHEVALINQVDTTEHKMMLQEDLLAFDNVAQVDFNDEAKLANLQNAAWGTIGTASFSASTITVNFSTGKDIQTVNISANATDLAITAPSGGAAKGLVLRVTNTNASTYTIGGGNDWVDVEWEANGPDLSTETVSVPGTGVAVGACVILTFLYSGSSWYGWVSEFDGVAV